MLYFIYLFVRTFVIHVSSCIFTSDVKTYENRGFPTFPKGIKRRCVTQIAFAWCLKCILSFISFCLFQILFYILYC